MTGILILAAMAAAILSCMIVYTCMHSAILAGMAKQHDHINTKDEGQYLHTAKVINLTIHTGLVTCPDYLLTINALINAFWSSTNCKK
jgi:hypothetical protein